jgi:hypothetical protein
MRPARALVLAASTLGVMLAPTPGLTFGATAHAVQPSPCLRFSFGEWTPPLNWEGAGHHGTAEGTGGAARRLRDSIFLQPGSNDSDGMVWDEKSGGHQVFVFPFWWPAGIVVRFDSTTIARDTLRGMAVALVADGSTARPATRVRALRVACGRSR